MLFNWRSQQFFHFYYRNSNAAENICPWELDDTGFTAKASSKADDNIKSSGSVATGHVRRGSDPTALISGKSCANTSSVTPSTVVQGGGNVSKNRLNPSATAVQNVAAAVTAGTLDPQQTSSVAKGTYLLGCPQLWYPALPILNK